MKCLKCYATVEDSFTTVVRELGSTLLIIRHVPCRKCTECNEVYFTGTVTEKIEQIVEKAKYNVGELSVLEFNAAA